jgi:flagellar biosynthesis chaperone FliJ
VLEINDYKLDAYSGSYEEYISKKEENKKAGNSKVDYKAIKDIISRLECELAFLSGQFNDKHNEEEKENLNCKFISTARELNNYKNKIKM